jgi:hypothetical protein
MALRNIRWEQLPPWTRPAARLTAPLLLAYLAITLEPYLTDLANHRPGVLPVAMVALIFAILIQRLRRWLIVTLCFGIFVLALRDMTNPVIIPPQIDYVVVERLIPYAWLLLALCAGFAGAAEALRPGSVLARRFYFATAAIYLGGHGSMALLREPSFTAAVLLVSGLLAVVGVVRAEKIVANEVPTPEQSADLKAIAAREQGRADRLREREWRDTVERLA